MKGNPSVRYRLSVASRVLAAALGGYALASALSVLLALIWPLPQAQAVLASTMLSFALYAAAVIWVFSVRSVIRAWLGMLVPATLAGLVCWLLMAGGAA
jgi:hypothetical protein